MYSVAGSIRNMGTLLRLASELDEDQLSDLLTAISKFAGLPSPYDDRKPGLVFNAVNWPEYRSELKKKFGHIFNAKSLPELLKEIGVLIKVAAENNPKLKNYSKFFNEHIANFAPPTNFPQALGAADRIMRKALTGISAVVPLAD